MTSHDIDDETPLSHLLDKTINPVCEHTLQQFLRRLRLSYWQSYIRVGVAVNTFDLKLMRDPNISNFADPTEEMEDHIDFYYANTTFAPHFIVKSLERVWSDDEQPIHYTLKLFQRTQMFQMFRFFTDNVNTNPRAQKTISQWHELHIVTYWLARLRHNIGDAMD